MLYLDRQGTQIAETRWRKLIRDQVYCLVREDLLPAAGLLPGLRIRTTWVGVCPGIFCVEQQSGRPSQRPLWGWWSTEALAVAAHEAAVVTRLKQAAKEAR